MRIIKGTSVFAGICIAPLALLQRDDRFGGTTLLPTGDKAGELKQFHRAREEAITQLKALYAKAENLVGEKDAAIFEVQQMMLEDADFLEGVENRIRAESLSTKSAVAQTAAELASLFQALDDPYMQARAADVLDASGRVEKNLTGQEKEDPDRYNGKILAAEDLTPSETMQLEPEKIGGFLLSGGNTCSHTAILARNLGIPTIVNSGIQIFEEDEGKLCILDGFAGTAYLEPDEVTLTAMRKKQQAAELETQRLENVRGKATVTLDGKRIRLYANAGSLAELPGVQHGDAEGIGLFRSEFLYLQQNDYPTEEQQFQAYKAVLEAMPGKRVIIRTLDMGADKQADYLALPNEANPALGLRGIRLCLARTGLFKTQLRALCRASVYGQLAIMFPLIISVQEVRQAKALLEEVQKELAQAGVRCAPALEVGIMIETPAAALLSDELAREVDFFSLGTNDLTQYTLALDRQQTQLDRFWNPHHPAVLKLIEMTVHNGHKAGIRVGLCGELGADLSLTEQFLRMGIDELSVAPAKILPLREKVRSLRLEM